MEVVYFVLGIVTVLLVLGILSIVKVKKKIEKLEEEFEFLERGLHDTVRDLHLRIDDEVRDLKFQNNETLLGIETELSELQFQISRIKKVF